MALPTILVNSATGSDANASGAGPGTAITGTGATTRNAAAQLHVGFFGVTTDLSSISTTGDAVLFIANSTAGQRNFSSIAALKNTRQTGADAAIVATTTALTVGSTTGWTTGDVISIAGAGAAGVILYTTITVLTATTATTADAASTTVAAANWENPKQPTLTASQGMNTVGANYSWAVGGKRASIGSTTSRLLFDNNGGNGDAMPGWVTEMESGHAETLSATLNIRRAGDANGAIILKGTSGAGTKPILTFSNNGDALFPRNEIQQYLDFEMQNTNGTKTAAFAFNNANGSNLIIKGIKCANSTNKFGRFMGASNNGVKIIGCEIGYCTLAGTLQMSNGTGSLIFGNYLHDNTGSGTIDCQNQAMSIINNLLAGNTGIGILTFPGANTVSFVMGNTINAQTTDGIEFRASVKGLFAYNNIISNCGGYGVSIADSAVKANAANILDCNDSYNNTSGAYQVAGIATNDPNVDPSYTNTGAGDYSVGTAVQALAYPLVNYPGSTTRSYVDIGAAQRQNTGGGGTTMFIPVE